MTQEPLDFDDDDEEPGELIPEPRLDADDSEIRVGDRIIFKFHHRAFRDTGGWKELAGVVLRILPGRELIYYTAVVGGIYPWPDQFVERRNITKALLPKGAT